MGIALFAIFGIVPGIVAGGAFGLIIADMFFSGSAYAEIYRILSAASGMMLGITLGSAVFGMASSLLGWLVGALVPTYGTEEAVYCDSVQGTKETQAENRNACHDNKGRGARVLTPHHAG